MLLSPLQYNGAYYARIIWEYLGKRWQRCSPVPTGLLLRLCGQFLQFAATPKIALGFRSLVLEILEGSTEVELQKHLTSCIVFPQVTWPLDKSLFCLLLLRIDCTHTHSPKLQIQPARSWQLYSALGLVLLFFSYYCDQIHNRKQWKEGRVNLALSSPDSDHLGSEIIVVRTWDI